MTTLNPYLKQYKKSQIETATPEQILILLYDGAINFLNKAKVCLDENSEDEFHKNMLRCKNIIAEFMQTLDLDQGGDWALSLYNLYKYLRKLILKADGNKDTEAINEVLKHLTSLRDTWQRAIEIATEERKQNVIDGVSYQSDVNDEQSSVDYEDVYDKKADDNTTYTYDDGYTTTIDDDDDDDDYDDKSEDENEDEDE